MLKRILGSKNIKNGMWLYLLQIFNTVIPLFTLPYVTRVLGRAGYGTFSIALNIISYLQVLVEYGFGMSATREVAISDKKNEKICKIFTSVICARLFLFAISIVISILYLAITKARLILWISLLVMLICLLGYCVQQNWLFQGMQDMKYVSLINIFARTISTILIFAFVKNETDIVTYSLLYSIAPLLGGCAGFLIAAKKYHLHLVKISMNDVKDELKKGWYVFTTQLSSKVFGAIGITFLGIFSTEVVVGTFSAIQKIPNIMMLAWMPISQVLYPIVSQNMQNSYLEGRKYVEKYQKIILPLFLIAGILVGVFSNIIVGIAFGEEYAEFSYWIIPLIVWLVLAINNNFLGIQTLLASGHDKEYSICFQISVGCTIILNFVLIKFFGGNGAAFAPMISEFVLFITLIFQIRKIDNKIEKEND